MLSDNGDKVVDELLGVHAVGDVAIAVELVNIVLVVAALVFDGIVVDEIVVDACDGREYASGDDCRVTLMFSSLGDVFLDRGGVGGMTTERGVVLCE